MTDVDEANYRRDLALVRQKLREVNAPEPSSELDQRVLQAARRIAHRGGRAGRRWAAPLAVAASLLMAAVLLWLPPASELPDTISGPERSRLPEPLDYPRVEPTGPILPEPGCSEVERRTPVDWQACIEALKAQGRTADAEREAQLRQQSSDPSPAP